MSRREVTERKPSAVGDDADAFGVVEFCKRHRISPQLFYKFRAEMPATFRVGTRVLVSREALLRGVMSASVRPMPGPTGQLSIPQIGNRCSYAEPPVSRSLARAARP